MADSKIFETLAYKMLKEISKYGDLGINGITSTFD
jgi:hypothetical protein